MHDSCSYAERASSQGSDWYRQMFNNLRKGVEDDLPNQKREEDKTHFERGVLIRIVSHML